jgi:3-deoxy-D-manno-octulosonic-acid transferase
MRVYSLLWYLLTPLIILRLGWRGLKTRAYFHYWPQRFGFGYPQNTQPTLWIHAVSLGETQAAIPLIQQLQRLYPHHAILITNMTPTGAACARQLPKVQQCYLPYDYPFAVQRFLRCVKPVLGILIETELWPNLIEAAAKNALPLILANARLSARSALAYQRHIPTLIQHSLGLVAHIAVQTETEAQRFIQLGANPARITVTGSIKFDVPVDENLPAKARHTRQTWGENRLVWIAASTHAGEEQPVLHAFSQIQAQCPDVLLILVPRHPERFNAVAELCRQSGQAMVRRSQQAANAQTAVYLADTMGELPLLYACADVAFVGGSLVPTGGHNVLEAATLGLPVVFGRHMFNFAHISQQLLAHHAAQQVENQTQLAQAVLAFLTDAPLRQQTGQRARQFIAQNRGALQKTLNIIQGFIQ